MVLQKGLSSKDYPLESSIEIGIIAWICFSKNRFLIQPLMKSMLGIWG